MQKLKFNFINVKYSVVFLIINKIKWHLALKMLEKKLIMHLKGYRIGWMDLNVSR